MPTFLPSRSLPRRISVVPNLSLYEVFKRVVQQRGEDDALQAGALMQQGIVIELSASLIW